MIRVDCRGLSTDSLDAAEEIATAVDCFVKHGYAILDNVVSQATIEALGKEFGRNHDSLMPDQEARETMPLGKARFMMALPFAGGFSNPLIFSNPYVLAVARTVLGPQAIIEAFGAIVSMEGAVDQPPHCDGEALFEAGISEMLPAHALTFALPLVEMNDSHGTVALWPGSHRSQLDPASGSVIRPTIPPGSCLLWDFRLLHSGTGNRSGKIRPLVYCTYSRPWYRDMVNFRRKPVKRLVLDDRFLMTLSEESRVLFSHVIEHRRPETT